jgi:tetratricopeptide (TPR) repeat protein
LYRIARYAEALPLYKQSLSRYREIGDKQGEGTILNNISRIYGVRDEYDTALKYLQQSLEMRREIGDRAGEAVTSWNIGHIYHDQGDLPKAKQYMSRAVQIMEEIGHPRREEYRQALEALLHTQLQDQQAR